MSTENIIVLVALAKLLLATSIQNTTKRWTQTVRKILLNEKLVTNAQKNWMHSNHIQPVPLQIVHVRLHDYDCDDGNYCLTVTLIIDNLDEQTMTTVIWINITDFVFIMARWKFLWSRNTGLNVMR